jgi:catechol-2,3-dioxygenase
MTVSPVRLNHAVLFVADVDRAASFYSDVFGMEVISREADLKAAFLRLPRSGNHHDLGLFGIDGAIAPPRGSVGLYHLAWQLDTVDELVEFRRILLDAHAYTGESSHGATKSIYGVDPDGNQFEIMWTLPRSQWGDYARSAVVERLDLAAELDRWSGIHTADESFEHFGNRQ